MSFKSTIERYSGSDLASFFSSVSADRINAILHRDQLRETDFLALLSPAAAPFIEEMAQRASDLTRRHFGNVIAVFTPLYISNYCDNTCSYCSFSRRQAIPRRHLSIDEIKKSAEKVSGSGIRHLLILTGESRQMAPPSYLEAAIKVLRDYFSSITIEVYPLTEDEYGALGKAGMDGLTIYQETYNRTRYHELHAGGPKENYDFRLTAPERACAQGIRTVTVGALYGLHDPCTDAFFAGLHAAYLQRRYPSVEVSIAFPRLRPNLSDFTPASSISDRLIVQMLVATRLFLPTAGITISTRESPFFRDNILPLGVTRMSAGVSTAVGGHTSDEETPQFMIADTRTVDQFCRDLEGKGFQPVMHDWNTAYCADVTL
ncbi:MAG: 2-iminoacetate synthase ThiH [Chitinispirillaceae bacterium]|nr:2-iminoacetate synthase ThiH [Chitinispirillaceae bacterium]